MHYDSPRLIKNIVKVFWDAGHHLIIKASAKPGARADPRAKLR
jgi:hypothetical protein